TFSIAAMHARWSSFSRGRKTMPTPYLPGAGSGIFSLAHSRRRNASGIWIRMPAPSPVSGSQPHAPRCVRFWRTVRPFSMMSCERSPLTLTTKPTPHASRSVRRSRRGLGSRMLRSPRVRRPLAVPARTLAGRRRVVPRQRELDALRVRRQHDHRLRPRHALDRSDLADQVLERRRVRRLHLEEQRVLPGHVVALEHAVKRDDFAFEPRDHVRVADDHADEGGDVEAETAAVEDGAIARDDARGFELLDALEHRRSAETDLLAEPGEGRPAILLQQGKRAQVYVVQLEVRAVAESHKVEPGFDR